VTDPDHLWSGNWRDRRREPAERPTVAARPVRPDDEPTLIHERAAAGQPPQRSRSPILPALAGGAISAVIVSAVLLGSGLVGGDDTTSSNANATVPTALPAAPKGAAASPPANGTVGAIYAAASKGVVSIQSSDGTGTGFVVDSDGTIVSNSHVVGNDKKVKVRFGDSGRPIDADVLGSDPSVDIAVLHVDPAAAGKLSPLALADSDQVKVGDTAIAIGNPLGLDRTATTGIVSGLGREIRAPNGFQIDKVIQTDAPINPGNSGGPLLDSRGRVIGVNSQIATAGAGSGNIGIGFAVPANTVRNVVPQLKSGQGVQHAYLGVSTAPATSGGGAEVGDVNPSSPAQRAGAEIGDLVTEVDGQAIAKPEDIATAIADNKPGDQITMKVRRNGQERSLNVTLSDRPATAPSTTNP
jgi:putative serine protease PepD